MLPKKEPRLWSSGSGFWKGRHLLKDKFVGSLHSSSVPESWSAGWGGGYPSAPQSVLCPLRCKSTGSAGVESVESTCLACKVPCSIPTHAFVAARVVGRRRRDRK